MAISRFKYERELLGRGLTRIAGVDEAGRGPLAGPVVAGAAMLPTEWMRDGLPQELRGLNDSKQLTLAEREDFFGFLTACPDVAWAVAVVGAEVIDRINILQASLRAMNEALEQLNPPPEHTLVDGLHISSALRPQTPIVEGDAKSFSIAAASVLAKVTRDRLMAQHDLQYPGYGFAGHKGYGTKEHLAAIERLGPCPIHRRTFAPIRRVASQPDLFPPGP